MKRFPLSKRAISGLFIVLGSLLYLSTAPVFAAPTPAGIVLDGSLGPSGALADPNYLIPANVGKQAGSNLFQSFSQFNLSNGQSATFTPTGSTGQINNILARVTGGNASSINGSIRSQISGANLFLVNPSGVLFGQNASVNVSGAFVVSSANVLKLGNGSFFGDVNHPIQDAGLSSAPITAFGFLKSRPKPVTFTGTQLSDAGGIDVLAGNISLNNATLAAPAGNISFFSAASKGKVKFAPQSLGASYNSATNTRFGTISLTNNSYANISGNGGGIVAVRTGALYLNNSLIASSTFGSAKGGSISVASHSVSLINGGQLSASAFGTGSAGNVNIRSESLDINGIATPSQFTGIASQAELGSGNGGEINLMVNGPIFVLNSGQISSATFAAGNAGNMAIKAQSVTVDGTATPRISTQISSNADQGSTGNAGTVNLKVNGAINLSGVGKISSSTASSGNGGDLTIHAGSLSINGTATPTGSTGIFLDTKSGVGNAGQVNLDILGATTLTNTGDISSDSTSAGNAGSVTMETGSLTINGSGTSTEFTQISSDAHGSGNAGQVNLTVNGNLTILGAGEIVSNTSATGNAGNVSIRTDSLTIDGAATPFQFTGISSNANAGSGNAGLVNVNSTGNILLTGVGQISSDAAANSSGTAGRVNVIADGNLSLIDEGEITSDASGSKNAGNITVQAGSLSIIGNNGSLLTGISSSAESGSSGNAGIVSVNVDGNISISNTGEIESIAFSSGNAGEVNVNAGSLSINGTTSNTLTGISSQADSGATGSAGLVTVTINNAISLTNEGEISSSTSGLGNAGEVTVQAGSVTMSGASEITSSAFQGSTGNAGLVNVSVNGEIAITNKGQIISGTFSSGNAGEVTVRGIDKYQR